MHSSAIQALKSYIWLGFEELETNPSCSWWADIPIKTKQSVYVTGNKVAGPPSVKWRGIFINDEAPALSTWIVGRFPRGPTGSDWSDGFYARIFELLLRSKANYMWPAMYVLASFDHMIFPILDSHLHELT